MIIVTHNLKQNPKENLLNKINKKLDELQIYNKYIINEENETVLRIFITDNVDDEFIFKLGILIGELKKD